MLDCLQSFTLSNIPLLLSKAYQDQSRILHSASNAELTLLCTYASRGGFTEGTVDGQANASLTNLLGEPTEPGLRSRDLDNSAMRPASCPVCETSSMALDGRRQRGQTAAGEVQGYGPHHVDSQ